MGEVVSLLRYEVSNFTLAFVGGIGLEDGSIRQKEKDLTELRSLDRGQRQASSAQTCPEEIFVRLSNDPNRHAQYAGKYVINGTSNHHAYYVKPPHAIHVHNSQKWTIGLILGLPLGNIMSTTIAACPTEEGL